MTKNYVRCCVFLQRIAQIRGGCRRKNISADQSSPSSVSQAATLLATTAVIYMATADQSTFNLEESDHEPVDVSVKSSNQNCSKLANDCDAMFDRGQLAAASQNNDETIISEEEQQHHLAEASAFTPSVPYPP